MWCSLLASAPTVLLALCLCRLWELRITCVTCRHLLGLRQKNVRLLSLYPSEETLRWLVSGVQMLTALRVPNAWWLGGSVVSACTPRRWLVSPTTMMWTLWSTVRNTPCRPNVRPVLTELILTEASPAMLLMSLVIALLNSLERLESAVGALLMALRSSVV